MWATWNSMTATASHRFHADDPHTVSLWLSFTGSLKFNQIIPISLTQMNNNTGIDYWGSLEMLFWMGVLTRQGSLGFSRSRKWRCVRWWSTRSTGGRPAFERASCACRWWEKWRRRSSATRTWWWALRKTRKTSSSFATGRSDDHPTKQHFNSISSNQYLLFRQLRLKSYWKVI